MVAGAENGKYTKTTYMALCGLFAALMAICSFISIPLGFTPVPVNLATLGVFLAGGLLGKKYGTLSLTVYVVLGAVGVPVFAGFRGGLSVLVGPTGGYIFGYIAAAFLIGLLMELMLADQAEDRTGVSVGLDAATASGVSVGLDSAAASGASVGIDSAAVSGVSVPSDCMLTPVRCRAKEIMCCSFAMIVGLLACYLLGTLWFIVSTHTGVWASLVACVFPFLPGDALKIAAGAFLVQRLRHLL